VDRWPAYALVANVDLVVIHDDDQVSVLCGRCLHRGALLSIGSEAGEPPSDTGAVCNQPGYCPGVATAVGGCPFGGKAPKM